MAQDPLKGYFSETQEAATSMADLWSSKGFTVVDFELDSDIDPEAFFQKRGFCVQKDQDPVSNLCCPHGEDCDACFLIPPGGTDMDAVHNEILSKIVLGQMPVEILPWLEEIPPDDQFACIGPLSQWVDKEKNKGKLALPGAILPTHAQLHARLVSVLQGYWRCNLTVASRGAALYRTWQQLTPWHVEQRARAILRNVLTPRTTTIRVLSDLTTRNLLRAISLTFPKLSGRIRDVYGAIPDQFILERGSWTVYHTLDRGRFEQKATRGRWWYYLGMPIDRAFKAVTKDPERANP